MLKFSRYLESDICTLIVRQVLI